MGCDEEVRVIEEGELYIKFIGETQVMSERYLIEAPSERERQVLVPKVIRFFFA